MVLVGLGVSACGADDDSASVGDSTADESEMDVEAPATEEPADVAAAGDEQAEAESVDTGGSATTGTPLPSGRALATTAGVVVATSDIRAAVDDTLTAAQRNGATVFTADVNIGDERDDGSVDGSGYFVVKMPPTELEPLIVDLGATVGRVSGRTQDTTDVTDQLVDLDIRIGVERDVIARFRSLLGEATEFEDIVEIERVISERTISLEQLLASQRNLDNRVERSTLTIELQYEAPAVDLVVEEESDDGIVDAWRDGWDVFLGALFAVGFVVAVAAPFLLTGAVLLVAVWAATRRLRRTRRGTHAAPVAASPVGERADEGVDNRADDELSRHERLAEPSPGG